MASTISLSMPSIGVSSKSPLSNPIPALNPSSSAPIDVPSRIRPPTFLPSNDACFSIKCVMFDLGGVVLGSPVWKIVEYERRIGLHAFELNRFMASSKLFHKLETGALYLTDFVELFQKDVDAKGWNISIRQLFNDMATVTQPRAEFVQAIGRLRQAGFITVAITNNWLNAPGDVRGNHGQYVDALFDHVIESAVEHTRKPDPHLFITALHKAGVRAEETIFMDDLTRNVYGAQALGFYTIKVGQNYQQALKQLQTVLDKRVDLGLNNHQNQQNQHPNSKL